MDIQLENEVFKKAITLFGKQAQRQKVKEELAELIVALSKVELQTTEESLLHLVEEIADVEIMLTQLKMMYCIAEHELNDMRHFKVTRLYQKIISISSAE
jgi:hypothetical protein